MTKPSRASARIALVLIGVGGTLTACSPEPAREVTRDRYASLDDCAADWGRPESCDREPESRQNSSHGGGFFLGPRYPLGYRGQAQSDAWSEARRQGRAPQAGVVPGDRAIGRAATTTQRGGFGSSGVRFSAGG